MRQALVIDRSVSVVEGDAVLAAHPGVPGELTLSYHLDYGRGSPIPAQSLCLALSPQSFRDELAPAARSLLESEATALRAAGIGARATPADLLIFGAIGRHRQRSCVIPTSASGTRSSTWSATSLFWASTSTGSWSRTGRATRPTTPSSRRLLEHVGQIDRAAGGASRLAR